MEHGYYFEELGFIGEPGLGDNVVKIFEGGSFPFDLARRKVKSLLVVAVSVFRKRYMYLGSC